MECLTTDDGELAVWLDRHRGIYQLVPQLEDGCKVVWAQGLRGSTWPNMHGWGVPGAASGIAL